MAVLQAMTMASQFAAISGCMAAFVSAVTSDGVREPYGTCSGSFANII